MADMKSFISCIWFAQRKDYKKVVVLFTDPTSSICGNKVQWQYFFTLALFCYIFASFVTLSFILFFPVAAKLQCIHTISSDACNNWDVSSPMRLRTVLTPCRARPACPCPQCMEAGKCNLLAMSELHSSCMMLDGIPSILPSSLTFVSFSVLILQLQRLLSMILHLLFYTFSHFHWMIRRSCCCCHRFL